MGHTRTLAALAGLATLLGLAATPARADWDGYGHRPWGGGWHRPWHPYRPYYPPPVYGLPLRAPPIYYPPPGYYAPPPQYYYAPPRTYFYFGY